MLLREERCAARVRESIFRNSSPNTLLHGAPCWSSSISYYSLFHISFRIVTTICKMSSQAEINDRHFWSDLNPTYLLIGNDSPAPQLPRAIYQKLRWLGPAWTRHWGYRVGNKCWGLVLDDPENPQAIRLEGPSLWRDEERRYKDCRLVGFTGATTKEVTILCTSPYYNKHLH